MVSRSVDPYMIDEDNPEWTEEDFKKARPGKDVLAELGMTPPEPKKRPGRPALDEPKKLVTVRLDAELVKALKTPDPKGWQTRLNAAARKGCGLD